MKTPYAFLLFVFTTASLMGVAADNAVSRSFPEILKNLTAEENLSEEEAAHELAEKNAEDDIGMEAVGFLAMHCQSTEPDWFRRFAERHPETRSGERAMEEFLQSTPNSSEFEVAHHIMQDYPGTRIALTAACFEIRNRLSCDSGPKLRQLLSAIINAYPPKLLSDAGVQHLVLRSLDAMGEPSSAYAITITQEGEVFVSEVLRALSEIDQRTDRALNGVYMELYCKMEVLFAADFANKELEKHAEDLAQLLPKALSRNVLVNCLEWEPNGHNVIQTLVNGMLRRSTDPNSAFKGSSVDSMRTRGLLCSALFKTFTLDGAAPCLDLCSNLIEWGALLEKGALYLEASSFFEAAMDAGRNDPLIVTTAAQHLARIYMNQWGALESAAKILEKAMAGGAQPPVIILLARIRYNQEEYESSARLLVDYLHTSPAPACAEKARFLLGMVYRKLGYIDACTQIWAELRATCQDDSLLTALNRAVESLDADQ